MLYNDLKKIGISAGDRVSITLKDDTVHKARCTGEWTFVLADGPRVYPTEIKEIKVIEEDTFEQYLDRAAESMAREQDG